MATYDMFLNDLSGKLVKDINQGVRDTFGVNQEAQAATGAAQQAVRAVGESKAQSLLENARLLQADVGALRKTGSDVFRVQQQVAGARTAETASKYLGSGVLLKGSAKQVTKNIQTQGFREAVARRDQYEFHAVRTQMQADIAQAQAGRERQAAEFEATSIQATAAANVKRELSSYLTRNAASFMTLQGREQQAQSGLLQPLGTYLTDAERTTFLQYQSAQKLFKELG